MLGIELHDFITGREGTITILGHSIRIVSEEGILISFDDLDDEVYDISQQKNARWSIVK